MSNKLNEISDLLRFYRELIIDFHFLDKTTRKKNKYFNNSGNESQWVVLDQKRELQKCNETITPLAVIVTTNMFLLG